MLRQVLMPIVKVSPWPRRRSSPMRVIKRYPNRKLYDTEAKQYVSLDEIAEFIRSGEDVYVVDNASGEDLTTITLTQIIFEQEKKGSGFLPQAVLTGLIQAGGSTLSALRRTLASSVEFISQVDDEIERRLQVLINRGELAEEEALRLRDKLVAGRKWSVGPRTPGHDRIEDVLLRQHVPTRADFEQLAEQIDRLAEKLADLAEPPASPAPDVEDPEDAGVGPEATAKDGGARPRRRATRRSARQDEPGQPSDSGRPAEHAD